MNDLSNDSFATTSFIRTFADSETLNFANPDPNDANFVNNLGDILEKTKTNTSKNGDDDADASADIEDFNLMRKQQGAVGFKLIAPKKYIGLHSFSRRLYRDVPDLFDVLKKLFFKMQYYIDRINPEVRKAIKLLI